MKGTDNRSDRGTTTRGNPHRILSFLVFPVLVGLVFYVLAVTSQVLVTTIYSSQLTLTSYDLGPDARVNVSAPAFLARDGDNANARVYFWHEVTKRPNTSASSPTPTQLSTNFVPSLSATSSPTCTIITTTTDAYIAAPLKLRFLVTPTDSIQFVDKDGEAAPPFFELLSRPEADRSSITVKHSGQQNIEKTALFVLVNNTLVCPNTVGKEIEILLETSWTAWWRHFFTTLFGAGGPIVGIAAAGAAWVFQSRRETDTRRHKQLREAKIRRLRDLRLEFRKAVDRLTEKPTADELARLAKKYAAAGEESDDNWRSWHKRSAKTLAKLIPTYGRQNLHSIVDAWAAIGYLSDHVREEPEHVYIDEVCRAILVFGDPDPDSIKWEPAIYDPFWAGVFVNGAMPSFAPNTCKISIVLGSKGDESDKKLISFLAGVIAGQALLKAPRASRSFFQSLCNDPAPTIWFPSHVEPEIDAKAISPGTESANKGPVWTDVMTQMFRVSIPQSHIVRFCTIIESEANDPNSEIRTDCQKVIKAWQLSSGDKS